ncbi:hypothetical protein POM88_008958 [Heracleum sosnowskyi]|uniref:Uncharacterized protein n=1 Tax=Heracleum sosnowskyi TaxID=360622 RepID=A0AAD8J773_9APIA|nr:hypothetical protein POM88_008958 [Heracleum sosnowskyi]
MLHRTHGVINRLPRGWCDVETETRTRMMGLIQFYMIFTMVMESDIKKSARLNNAPVKIPTEVKSYQKSSEIVEVTSARKSTRLMSARPEINDMISKKKPKSTEKKGARKSTSINNQQANDENVNLKSSSVRRKLDLHNPKDEDENMDENDIQFENLPPSSPLESSPVKLLTITEYKMIKLQNIWRNNEKLKALNLPALATGLVYSMKKNKGKKRGEIKMHMFQKMMNKVEMMLQKVCLRKLKN